MTEPTIDPTGDVENQLCWALSRLAMWGESADPQVRYEAKTHAKTTLQELTREVQG